MRNAIAATLIVGALLVGGVVGLTSGGDADASGRPASYCAAALRALRYGGADSDHFQALLDPVVNLAPRELRATAVALQRAAPGSPAFTHAHERWQNDTTNECCECIGGHNAPTVEATVPR